MSTRIGINGFGRVGRITLRTINQYHRGNLEVVAINSSTDPADIAHLFKWDSTYGPYDDDVSAKDKAITINGKDINIFAEREPANIPWSECGVDIVIDCTGNFNDALKATAHLKGSVKKVIISAPAKNDDATIVMGVNEDIYQPQKHNIISNASCTTNCLAPIVKVLQQKFGIQKGLMTTIHAYTGDQRLQDNRHKDLRRARAAAENIVPTTTGAAKAIGHVMPELEGKLQGISVRVPVPTVSMVDLVAELNKSVTTEEVNAAFKFFADGKMKGILEYCQLPLVSSDFKGNPASSIFDSLSTIVIGDNMVKVLAWYDNEWGYCCRLGDLAKFIADKGL